MAELILIRHGQSVANRDHRFAEGWHVPLTSQGREEAAVTASLVSERFDPVALYSSHFIRALETARIIGAQIGLEPVQVEEICEQDYGELSGRPISEVARFLNSGVDPWTWCPPGGESLRNVADRVGPAIDALAERHFGEQIVVVCHGAVMMATRAYVTRSFDGPLMLSSNAGGYLIRRTRTGYEGPFDVEGLTEHAVAEKAPEIAG